MVDVTGKSPTHRVAEARCVVCTAADTMTVLADPPGGGDLLETARLAGILAAKQTSSLIPLCHPIRLDEIAVTVGIAAGGFEVTAVTQVVERTGVEMEALTGCATAALVLLQACLERDPLTRLEGLTLWHKSGGRSGTWERDHQGVVHGDRSGR